MGIARVTTFNSLLPVGLPRYIVYFLVVTRVTTLPWLPRYICYFHGSYQSYHVIKSTSWGLPRYIVYFLEVTTLFSLLPRGYTLLSILPGSYQGYPYIVYTRSLCLSGVRRFLFLFTIQSYRLQLVSHGDADTD